MWGAGSSAAVTGVANSRGGFVAEPTLSGSHSLPDLTFVEQVARSGSISRSSRCSTALGQSVDSRANIMKVSIYTKEER